MSDDIHNGPIDAPDETNGKHNETNGKHNESNADEDTPQSEEPTSRSAVAVAEGNGRSQSNRKSSKRGKGGNAAKGIACDTENDTACSADEFCDDADTHGKQKFVRTKLNLKWKIPLSFYDLCIVTLGVVIPLGMLLTGCAFAAKRLTLVLLNHPLETCIQILFALLIPLANFRMWRSLKREDHRFSALRGVLAGSAVGAALTICAVCTAALIVGCDTLQSRIGTTFETGFSALSAFTFVSMLIAAFQINRFRLARDFRSSRAQVLMFSTFGIILSITALCATEAKSFYVRLAEKSAVANDKAERDRGLNVLRTLNVEPQLRMECTDDRAAGLAGLFYPIKLTTQRQLYFAITGKPFRDVNAGDLSAMSDDYLRRHVVGEPVKGLTLARSLVSGALSPSTLTSTVNWTYVFKNESAGPQEARAEIALPAGTAVTGMTLWINGEATDAHIAVSVSEKGQGDQDWVQADHDCPAMLTPVGHGRFLLHCYPVEQDQELKIRMTMVVPLKAESATQAALPIPRFVAANFTLDGEHMLRLKSPLNLKAHSSKLKHTLSASGQHIIAGPLSKEELKGTETGISAQLPAKMEQVAVYDMISTKLKEQEEKEKLRRKHEQDLAAQAEAEAEAEAELAEEDGKPQQVVVMIDGSRGVRQQLEDVARILKPAAKKKQKIAKALKKGQVAKRYVVETIKPISVKPPKNLIVVLDGSSALAKQSDQITAALRSIPRGVITSVMVASDEQKKVLEPLALESGVKLISDMKFVGGQDNLQAVVKASELAGESSNGAVLWIHGPQPAFNREIYIMSQYSNVPAFYEYSIDSGETDTLEFFKNHSEIGPFTQIPKGVSLSKDIESFVSRWQSDRVNYAVALAETTDKPTCRMATPKEAAELMALHANAYCEQLISERKAPRAATIAATYGLVTSVSSAIVPNRYLGSNLAIGEQPPVSSSDDEDSPKLQGATNGTVGPQGQEGSYITGINTAGTVRVNNLANLESLLNIFANLIEMAGGLIGFALMMHGIFQRRIAVQLPGLNLCLNPTQRIVFGVCIMILALSVPGVLNWFIASARDANMFS